MTRLDLPPTKSTLIATRGQLALAVEGFDLLEQKRQILLMALLAARDRETQARKAFREAFEGARRATREALTRCGTLAVEEAASEAASVLDVTLTPDRIAGVRVFRLAARARPYADPPAPKGGVCGGGWTIDVARDGWLAAIPAWVALAEAAFVERQLARALRKTQRRCNALSKVFIPAFRDTIQYVGMTLEERDREFLVVIRRVRDRLRRGRGRDIVL